jgi:thiol-disulfide isomerase/thioredoxin
MSDERDVMAPVTLTRQDFLQLLQVTKKPVILKFGATWCGPCRRIEDQVSRGFHSCKDSAVCINVDIDESIDLYAFLKSKRMVQGVPTLLAYRGSNDSFAPDLSVTGADPAQVAAFFSNCARMR